MCQVINTLIINDLKSKPEELAVFWQCYIDAFKLGDGGVKGLDLGWVWNYCGFKASRICKKEMN